MAVSDWSATADENTSIDGINIAEHCPAKNMNDALRAVMAALKNKCDTLDDTDNTLRRGAVIGEIRWFAMSTPPEGWLLCNGAAVAKSDYPELFAAIGTTYGSGDGSTTFNLPNLMGKVPWGSSSQVGTEMEAGVPNIKGELQGISRMDNYQSNGVLHWKTMNFSVATAGKSGSAARDIVIDASIASSIYGKSDTVQPPALCLLPCIRYE